MTAVTLAPVPSTPWGVVVGNLVVTTSCTGDAGAGVVLLLCCVLKQRSRDGFVGWEPHSGRKQSCYLCTTLGGQTSFEGLVCPGGVWCKLSAY